MLFLKWRTCGCFLLVWVNYPPISKGNLEKTFYQCYELYNVLRVCKTLKLSFTQQYNEYIFDAKL